MFTVQFYYEVVPTGHQCALWDWNCFERLENPPCLASLFNYDWLRLNWLKSAVLGYSPLKPPADTVILLISFLTIISLSSVYQWSYIDNQRLYLYSKCFMPIPAFSKKFCFGRCILTSIVCYPSIYNKYIVVSPSSKSPWNTPGVWFFVPWKEIVKPKLYFEPIESFHIAYIYNAWFNSSCSHPSQGNPRGNIHRYFSGVGNIVDHLVSGMARWSRDKCSHARGFGPCASLIPDY